MNLRWGSHSITGQFRENNEDRCFVEPQGRYFLLADGMGGQAAGEKASEMAVELISQKLDQLIDYRRDSPGKILQSIDDAVSYANLEIIACGQIDASAHSMGTTIALVVQVNNRLFVAGVGDSPVLLVRDGTIEQLTTDHSLTQALIDAGTITPEEALTHRYRNVLYRYLGTKDGGTGAEAQVVEPQPGDRLVICSDGVTDGLDLETLRQLVESLDDPQAVAEALVAAAEQGGSRDNITVVVLFVD